MIKKKTKGPIRDITQPSLPASRAMSILVKSLEQQPFAHDQPKEVEPNKIKRMVSLFQPRELIGRLLEDEQHLNALERAVGKPPNHRMLDPMLVWWCGEGWMVLDGHHRLEAYKRAGVKAPVPVEIFEGSIEDALLESAARNSKDKMPMRQADKVNRAWRMVCITTKSIKQIADACQVGTTTISNMRKVKKLLLEPKSGSEADLADMQWVYAKNKAQGGGRSEAPDLDEIRRQKAVRMAQALNKAVGRVTIGRDPEVFAEAIKVMDDRAPQQLMDSEAWKADWDQMLDLKEFRGSFEQELSSSDPELW